MSKLFLLPAHQLQTKCKLYQFRWAAPATRDPLLRARHGERRRMRGRYRGLAPAPSTTGPVEPCPPLVEAAKPQRGSEARKMNRASSSTFPTAPPGARSRARRCCRSSGTSGLMSEFLPHELHRASWSEFRRPRAQTAWQEMLQQKRPVQAAASGRELLPEEGPRPDRTEMLLTQLQQCKEPQWQLISDPECQYIYVYLSIYCNISTDVYPRI